MVSIKEAGSTAQIQFPETPIATQNGFVWFIEENQGLFDRHSSLTHELRGEREGWKRSPTIEQLIKDRTDVVLSMVPSGHLSTKGKRKILERMRWEVYIHIFGSKEESDTLHDKDFYTSFVLFKKINIKSREPAQEIEDRMEEIRKNFNEIKVPMAADLQESKNELFERFREFLFSNAPNIFKFQRFLSDKEQAGERETIRPFLVDVSQSETRAAKDGKPSMLAEAVKKWIDELKERPTPEIIDEFSLSIKKFPKMLGWLEFSADNAKKTPRIVTEGENYRIKHISNFLKTIDFKSCPEELREALASFISSKYMVVLYAIRKRLSETQPTITLKAITQQHLPLLEEKIEKVEAVADKGPGAKIPAKKEAPKREKYPVGALVTDISQKFPNGIKLLTEEELSSFLDQAANNLAPSDSRMKGDICRIVENLLNDPYGLGTEKIFNTVTIGARKVNLRSMKAKGRGINLEHPESSRLRVVYTLANHSDPKNTDVKPVVILEGIYHHNDFDKKFL